MAQELVITQQVSAPPTQVYADWLTPEGLARWWWVDMGDTTYDVTGYVGGDYLIRSRSADIGVRGTFTHLAEPHVIEMTWIWLDGADPGPEELVRVVLAEQDGGTLVTVKHQVNEADGVEPYRQGWVHVLGNLHRVHEATG